MFDGNSKFIYSSVRLIEFMFQPLAFVIVFKSDFVNKETSV